MIGSIGPDLEVTALGYPQTSEELGFGTGSLQPDPDGAVLPGADDVYVTRAQTRAWAAIERPSEVVRAFRARVKPPAACPTRWVGTFSAPPRSKYVNDDRPTVVPISSTSAMIILDPEKVISVRDDWSTLEHELPKLQLSDVIVTGTTALARSGGCISRLLPVASGGLDVVPWLCGVAPGRLVPGIDGSFGAVTEGAARIYDSAGHLRLSYLTQASTDEFQQLVGDDLFGISNEPVPVVRHASPNGYAEEAPIQRQLAPQSLAVVRGRIYVSSWEGKVFVRNSDGSWSSLGDSEVDMIEHIVSTPQGLLVTSRFDSDSAREYLDGHGWCDKLSLASGGNAVVRLGNRFGLYRSSSDHHLLLDLSP